MDLIKDCPTLYPTDEEFGNFERFVSKISKRQSDVGIVRIVPPRGWRARQSYTGIENGQIDFTIRTPIEQHWIGQQGVYRQVHFIIDK
jgi:[histone H3]-trimethyl-L-lysine9/36 demethylase